MWHLLQQLMSTVVMKAALVSIVMKGYRCVPIKLYLQKQAFRYLCLKMITNKLKLNHV